MTNKPTEAKEIVHDKWLRWKGGELSAEAALDALFDEVVCPPLSGSSTPQEPDFPSDATKRMAKTLGADFVPHGVAQEPDDALAEAETYRQMHATARELGYPSILEALEALSRLQAKAPETDYCGIVEEGEG